MILPSQRHGHVKAQAQVQAGVLQGLAEALLGFRAALEQAVQQALRAEHGIGIAAQVGHGVAEQVAAAGVQFPQHTHELLPEAGLAPCPVLPQLQQRGLLRAGDVAPVAVRRIEAAVAVQGQALRLRRQGLGQRVDLGLHPRQRVRYPLLRQLLDVGEVEGGLELVPAGGEGQAGDLGPRAHQRPQGLAVFGRGRRDGQGAGEVVGGGGGRGGVLFGVELVQHVQHPAAECLGNRRAGEHGHEVAAAQGEDAGLAPEVFQGAHFGHVGYFNDLRHLRCELVSIALIQVGNLPSIGISQSAGEFGSPNPKAILIGDRGQGDFVENQSLCHDEPRYGF